MGDDSVSLTPVELSILICETVNEAESSFLFIFVTNKLISALFIRLACLC